MLFVKVVIYFEPVTLVARINHSDIEARDIFNGEYM